MNASSCTILTGKALYYFYNLETGILKQKMHFSFLVGSSLQYTDIVKLLFFIYTQNQNLSFTSTQHPFSELQDLFHEGTEAWERKL